MRRLVAYVHVDGKVFAPGDMVPDEFAARITNPAAWQDQDAAPADTPDRGQANPVPPQSGPGSGAKAWAAYAAASGVAVPDNASRDDIIAAMEQAGIPTRPEE